MTQTSIARLTGILLLAVAGCGGSSGPGSSTPVKSTPLAGTIAGKAFSPRSAFASSQSSGKQIEIWAKDGTCQSQPQLGDGDVEILFSVTPWTTGTAYALKFDLNNLADSKTVTFVIGTSGTPQNNIITTGRVELIDAGDTNQQATLRLRASGGANGSVEGEVQVTVCD